MNATEINIREKCISEGICLTENGQESIYILPDGAFVDGCFYNDVRTEDHRILGLISSFDRYDGDLFWLELFNDKNIIMLIPEIKKILITKNQKATQEQTKKILELLSKGYSIEEFY